MFQELQNKGWDTFLQTVNLLKNYDSLNYIVVGDGDEIDEYYKTAADFRNRRKIIKFDLAKPE